MDRILQEILVVGRRLEGMDSMMTSLTEDTKSMRLDIADFQSRVTTLERVTPCPPPGVSKSTQIGPQMSRGDQPPTACHCLLLATYAGSKAFAKSTHAGSIPYERPLDTDDG
ncbi:hypothetical protein NDU88_002353 [Pleurodeles waltl]|uniref:Uncharacterized protein n=1 Tax=Pleurodeles waltl TaxID=8319 RepID=A0AAV7Q8I4_PLEWA|nr:hypothetical protein NDU88_002353 [Pleurodeles waltl]